MNRLEKLLLAVGAFTYLALTVFSYAYVDLNLTLNQSNIVLSFVSAMQSLGYYNRGIGSTVYLLLLLILYSFFAINIYLSSKNKLTIKYLLTATIIFTMICAAAYPFLSYDLFNYMFDSKIVVKYHLSPFTHKALDFPQDDWLRFMRWVHRYSPYGPLWIIFTLPPALLSFGKFIFNFFLLKLAIAAFHLINTYIIFKILKKISPTSAIMGTVFYALNPIFIIEGIVNAHNDVVVATFLLLPIYLLINQKKVLTFLSVFSGFLIKYLPILNLPWFIYTTFAKNKNVKQLVFLNIATLGAFTYLYSSFKISVPFVSSGSTQVQFQPWYLFWTLPYVALIFSKELAVLAIALSFGASLRYLPYLYYSDWSQPGTILFMQTVTVVPVCIVAIVLILKHLTKVKPR